MIVAVSGALGSLLLRISLGSKPLSFTAKASVSGSRLSFVVEHHLLIAYGHVFYSDCPTLLGVHFDVGRGGR